MICSHPPPSFFLLPGCPVLEARRSIHFHPLRQLLDQETPLGSHGVQGSIRMHTYGERFKYRYFVYVMTKGEELIPDVAVLEKLLQVTMNEGEFLSNITHCSKYGFYSIVYDYLFLDMILFSDYDHVH